MPDKVDKKGAEAPLEILKLKCFFGFRLSSSNSKMINVGPNKVFNGLRWLTADLLH